MKIGYIRVSTQEQNTMRQEVLMEQLGVDQIYIDRSSGKNANRPELKTMLEFIRKGDVVIVESISRFARNTKDLLELVEQLTAKGVDLHMGAEEQDGKIVHHAIAPDLTLYCLRHTFCTDLQRAGVAINIAKELMGHSSIAVTADIYTHRNLSILHQNISRLDSLDSGILRGNAQF